MIIARIGSRPSSESIIMGAKLFMKRLWIYILIVIASYFTGVLFYRAALNLLAVPQGSEYHLLFTGINLFFIFVVVPSYCCIILMLRFFRSRSTILHTLVLILFGFFPSTMVPFMMGFGFGYLTVSQYFFSEMAILPYSFFTGRPYFSLSGHPQRKSI
jgi:hypothetical protein